jgi:hypothetical protein
LKWSVQEKTGHYLEGVPRDLLETLIQSRAFPSEEGLCFKPATQRHADDLQAMSQQGFAQSSSAGWRLTPLALATMQAVINLHNPLPVYPSCDEAGKESWNALQCWRYLEDNGWLVQFCSARKRMSLPAYMPSEEGALKHFYVSTVTLKAGRVFPLYLKCLANADEYAAAYQACHGVQLAISHGWKEVSYSSLINSNGQELTLKKAEAHAALCDDSGLAVLDQGRLPPARGRLDQDSCNGFPFVLIV